MENFVFLTFEEAAVVKELKENSFREKLPRLTTLGTAMKGSNLVFAIHLAAYKVYKLRQSFHSVHSSGMLLLIC